MGSINWKDDAKIYIEYAKYPKTAMKGGKKSELDHVFHLQDLLLNDYYQDSVVLAQG